MKKHSVVLIGLGFIVLMVSFWQLSANASTLPLVHDSWEYVPLEWHHDSWMFVPHEWPPAPQVSTGPPPVFAQPPKGPVEYSPGVEQWRTLVTVHFPAHQVENALWVMACESGGDPYADNPRSTASGLFQFLDSTWARTPYAGASVYDPEPNIAAAAWLGNVYEAKGRWFWTEWSCQP